MPRIHFDARKIVLVVVAGLLAPLFVTTTHVAAQTEESVADSTTESQAASVESKSRLSIKIDSDGIRIEGDTDGYDLDTLGADERDYDDFTRAAERVFREQGTDIVKFGEDVFIAADELVRGDIVVFGGEVVIEGKVVGNVVVMAGNADVRSGAEISGDVVVLGGVLDEEPESLIHGERVEFAEFAFPAAAFSTALGSHVRVFEFFFVPIKFFISIILSFLIILFLKERVIRTKEHVTDSVLKSFGTGFLVVFLGLFVVTMLTIVLLITLIGIPLAIVLIISCVAVFIISYTVAAYALGIKVNEKLKIDSANPFAIVLIGTAVLYLPALIGYGVSLWPLGGGMGAVFKIAGALISLFAYLVGIGALFLSRFGSRPTNPEPVPAVADATGGGATGNPE